MKANQAKQLDILVRENAMLIEIKALENKLNEIKAKRESIHRTAVEFESESQVILPRRNGWITDEEKKKIQKYFAAGISAQRLAGKLSCSVHTVYRYTKVNVQ